jgi:transcription antitermination factor NusA-like protein
MTRDESLQVIRGAFAHVDVLDIVVEYDPLVEEDVAKVVVRDAQLDDALGENGCHARDAAMRSGIAVEVVLENERDRLA